MDKNCYLLTKFDPVYGIKDSNSIIKSIICSINYICFTNLVFTNTFQNLSHSNEFILKDLKLSKYQIKVDFITPYGTQGSSNQLSYSLSI